MIITISGDPGSGKSSVAKAIAKSFNIKHYSAGEFMRAMAQEKGVSLMDLTKEAEKNPEIDKEIDKRTEELGKKEDNFVIDSRIGFHFIPSSIKIFLKVKPEKAAERTWRDIVNGKRATENQYKSEKEVLSAIKKRQNSEKKRYLKYYNIDMLDMKNYDFVLDTTKLSLEEEIKQVLDYLINHT